MKKTVIHFLILVFSQQSFARNDFNSEYGGQIHETLTIIQSTSAKRKNFSSLWFEVRESFNPMDRAIVDTWLLQNPEAQIPQLETVKTRDAMGEAGLRLVLAQGSETISLEYAGTPDQFVRSGRTKLEIHQALNLGTIASELGERAKSKKFLALSETNSFFSEQNFGKMSHREFAEYIVHLRQLIESAQAVEKRSDQQKNKRQYSWILEILLSKAQAVVGDICLDKFGFQGKVIEIGKCEVSSRKVSSLFTKVECTESASNLCNPMIYGLDRAKRGQGICLSSSDVESGKTCAQLSPLRKEKIKNDVESMIESILLGGDANEKTKEQMAKELNQYINLQVRRCEKEGQENWQVDAQCSELIQRKAGFNSYMIDVLATQSGDGGGEKKRLQASSESFAKNESRSSDLSSTSCNWFCSLNKFIQSPLGIVATTVVGISALCAMKARLFNICTRSKTTTAGTSSNTNDSSYIWTPTFSADHSLPTTPTAPVYSGGVQ